MKDENKFPPVRAEIINPKSITINELFGYFDNTIPPQWHDGILSTVLKKMCQDTKEVNRWMILDGPVDTLWIESMNSVLDDNKILTLNNGDRIALSPRVRLLFEVENLAIASPATVSRAGMIYVDIEDLGWRPYVEVWIEMKTDSEVRELLEEMIEKYLPKVLQIKKAQCKELVPTSEFSCVRNMCQLFDNQVELFPKIPEEDHEGWKLLMEKLFVYCLIWSVGATVEERSRKNIDYVLRDIESIFPHQNTIYEHYINIEKRDWASWEEKIPATYRPQEKDLEFHIISVPTIDTARNKYLVQSLLKHGSQVLLVGHTGVGKTALVESVLLSVDISIRSFTINFSAGTTSEGTQNIIESNFDKRAKQKYSPKDAKKKALCFIDDLNMPRKDRFGSQPPLELIRQWIDYGKWYNREKLCLNEILNLQFLCAMGKPGGGRAEISNRLMSKYHIINYTIPDDSQMKRIFESIAAYKLQNFEEEVKNLAEPMAISTINLFSIISEKFLPTPAKSHYVFNMRDISKVFQGIYRADKSFHDTKEHLVKLWAHEVLRVFQDRLIQVEDATELRGYLDEQLETHFQMSFEEYCLINGEDAIYVDFLNENTQVYEEVEDFEKLRIHLVDHLERYNQDRKNPKMDLVLFKDCIYHIARVYRVMSLKRGHAFLVGVGGSGRHSVTRLASYLNGMRAFALQVTKEFGIKDFRDFLKELYEHAGFRGKRKKKATFIFSENDIVMEAFLEDVNNMLSSGLVPNLFSNEELAKIREEIRPEYKKRGNTLDTTDALNEFFFSEVKDNLHIAICMSPLGREFKDYCRMYPALINNTTIDWFMKWPEDALVEVAKKYISAMDIPEELKNSISQICCNVHITVGDNAEQMFNELKRVYHVTPTNYIELMNGYDRILLGKRKEIGEQIAKLRSGLDKLDDARKQVEEMTTASEIKRGEVSKESKACEELMQQMSKEQANADEQMKIIETERIKINKEKDETLKMAADAEKDLKRVEPALIAAEESLEKLDKKYIAEIKSFPSPPAEVEMVMYAVMVILGRDATWLTVKKELADPQFVKKIKEYDKDKISSGILKKIERYTKKEEFDPVFIQKKSEAAGALCIWVRSMEDYAKALKVVGPKRQRKLFAEEQLAKKIESLQKLEASYKEVTDRLAELNATLEETQQRMESFKKDLNDLQTKIDTGEKLVSNLSGEKERWEASLSDYDIQFEKLTGDCILCASIISYNGPFTSEYRDNLLSLWINSLQALNIPYTQYFEFSEFLVGAATIRDWNLKGLPTDKFSVDNGVMAKKGNRWPLMIDPQTQGLEWTKNMERKLLIADIKDPKYFQVIEKAVTHGKAVIMPDVGEELDPSLNPILEKDFKKTSRGCYIKLGPKEIEYNEKFRLFITTRMSNPLYDPEISTRVCIINFTVKESGLEEQLLGIVVEMEQPSLEKSKNEQVQKISSSKKQLIALEDQILSMLSNSKVSLIEDLELVKTLESSKATSDEVKQTLESAEQTMKRVDEAREAFRPCGKEASVLFFVLSDLNKIDPMYQFSLTWYKQLFTQSIITSRDVQFQDRYTSIMKEHTSSVYKNACMSLFERHKLLLSLQMCVKLNMAKGEIDRDDWNFFLRGGNVLDRTDQVPKPSQIWITAAAWDNICDLETSLPEVFTGLTASITHSPKEWHRWYMALKPEQAPLPAEWETKCEEKLKKMIVLRCLRPDRILYACMEFVELKMRKEFIEAKTFTLPEVYKNTSSKDPIIFVLSPGVDPSDQLSNLALAHNAKINSLALGKGQSENAKKVLQDGVKNEEWVYLANCHLSISILPSIESEIEGIMKSQNVPKDFRIFMSSNPHDKFPVSLLQRSVKLTSEPPKGIKANMMRMYGLMPEFQKVEKSEWYRRAMFGLCWFHAIVIERKKFKTLGWNASYSFNDSDFSVCEDLLASYMGRILDSGPPLEYEKVIPWKAIQYLIAEANYGGRVTDDWDRRLIIVYAEEIFNERLITEQRWKPIDTEGLTYQYIDEEEVKGQQNIQGGSPYDPQHFLDDIMKNMEPVDHPKAFGQHVNAEITSQILDANSLLGDILSLQPQQISGGDGISSEESVLKMIADLKENLPTPVSVAEVKHKHKKDDSPLKIVLVQEIQRYNSLLLLLDKQLEQLEKGIKGTVVISPELEEVMISLNESRVPSAWGFLYFSLKPLASWIRDLDARYNSFNDWAFKSIPSVFWISAFTYPTGFTTALLQKFSRKPNGIPIDELKFEFIIESKQVNEIFDGARDGAYVIGLYLEGAKWEVGEDHLMEPDPMALYCKMPIIQFKPTAGKGKGKGDDDIYVRKGDYYKCPAYYYPIRDGTVDRESFIMTIDLKTGANHSQDYWIKRGTALLLSLGE
eukprot:scpid3161/ scgid17821/ Dynein heavy chain 2, axonemal; Axonemal beta dynein heavy chain 2; Ciliary dynein heavy chain 2